MKTPVCSLGCLTQEERDFFFENGYLHLPGVVSPDVLVALEIGLTRWVDRVTTRWLKKGLITDTLPELPLNQRLRCAWLAAGKPHYKIVVMQELACKETFDFIRQPVFLNIVKSLYATHNVMASAAFMCRPKLPNHDLDIDTPWHQDAQCNSYHGVDPEIVTFWTPLMDVDEGNACLQVAAGHHRNTPVFESILKNDINYSIDDSHTAKFTNLKAIPMKRGDVLVMHHLLPHRSLSNTTDRMRWSMDVRYEPIGEEPPLPKRGFVCAHSNGDRIVESYEQAFAGLWDNLQT